MEPGSYIPYKYLPVLITMMFATVFGLGGVFVNKLVAPRKFNPVKFLAYESGNLPSGEPRERFFIGFFLLGILFIVFDVEVIFLYPWAVAFDFICIEGFWLMIIFIALILIGYIYEIFIGAITWHRK